MPVLPSGIAIGIGHQAIPEDMGINWFSCPEGDFWHKRPDEKISPPPYDGKTTIMEDFVHSPIPKTTECKWRRKKEPRGGVAGTSPEA